MKLYTKKKTCYSCRAYQDMQGSTLESCDLGYSCKNMEPQEKCPKPLTYADYIYAYKYYKKQTIKKDE